MVEIISMINVEIINLFIFLISINSKKRVFCFFSFLLFPCNKKLIIQHRIKSCYVVIALYRLAFTDSSGFFGASSRYWWYRISRSSRVSVYRSNAPKYVSKLSTSSKFFPSSQPRELQPTKQRAFCIRVTIFRFIALALQRQAAAVVCNVRVFARENKRTLLAENMRFI